MSQVTAHGFGVYGIRIGGWNGRSGYSRVRIDDASVYANGGGVMTYGLQRGANSDVRVTNVRAYNNPGVYRNPTMGGSGILLGSVFGGTIEDCEAYENGRGTDGAVGIWTYDSDRIVIQHNESHHNHTSGDADGDGFDLDQNVTGSIVQYNYSYENDGAGYLLCQSPDNAGHSGNVVRYNISRDDGRRNRYGGIDIWGRVRNAEIYNNTIIVSPVTGALPRAIQVHSDPAFAHDVSSVHVRSNLLRVSGGLPLVDVSATQLDGARDLVFRGNAYRTGAGAFRVLWGATTYSSLAAWRTGARQESGVLASTRVPTGINLRTGRRVGRSLTP